MRFRITSLNIDEIIKTSFFRVDYLIESDKDEIINTIVSIYDPFFNIEHTPGSMDVSVSTNCIYWVGFDVDKTANDEKPNFKFGFRLLIEDLDNNIVLHNQVYRTTFEYNKEDKTVWIFGDSHVWESFGGYSHNPAKISEFNCMRVSLTSLSLNRFVNGDYLSFINAHSIKPDDCIVFYLGEIDFRHAIHKYCEDKSKDLVQTCLDLMNDYYKAIKNVKRIYNNRIIIMAPNPPMRDNYLDTGLALGTEKERVLCWNIFDNFWKSKDVEYLDWTNDYRSEDTLIDISKLMKRNGADFHILDYQYCINSLSKKLNNKKVIVKLMGGLGNQMYQYAFAKNISNKTGRKLILDLSHLKRRDLGPDYFYRNFELDMLNINDFEIVDIFSEECIRYENYIDSDEISILNTISNIVNDKSDNIYLDGYWASPLYFSSDIKSEFFVKDIIKESKSLLTEIQSTNSVMINIRRTDFLKTDFHGFYGKDYFLNAINELQQTETDLKFFIFSDDVEWCVENLSDIPNSKIVHHTISGSKDDDSLSDLESTKRDFNLMYNCKHFIISNSTFGWWSAYLGKQDNKKVIHPEIWLKGINSTCDLLFYGLNWNKL